MRAHCRDASALWTEVLAGLVHRILLPEQMVPLCWIAQAAAFLETSERDVTPPCTQALKVAALVEDRGAEGS